MFFIAFAYRELNRAVPDCGTTFTWATKAFGPWVGWMGGWGVAVAGIIVLANLAQIGGNYFWLLIGQPSSREHASSSPSPASCSSPLMIYVSYRGIEIGEKLQNVLLGIQYLALAALRGLRVRRVVDRHGARGLDDARDLDGSTRSPSTSLRRLHRGDPARAVHLLGLGHLPRAQRGDQGPEAHPRSRGAALDAHPARHLRARSTVAAIAYAGLGTRARPRQRETPRTCSSS